MATAAPQFQFNNYNPSQQQKTVYTKQTSEYVEQQKPVVEQKVGSHSISTLFILIATLIPRALETFTITNERAEGGVSTSEIIIGFRCVEPWIVESPSLMLSTKRHSSEKYTNCVVLFAVSGEPVRPADQDRPPSHRHHQLRAQREARRRLPVQVSTVINFSVLIFPVKEKRVERTL